MSKNTSTEHALKSTKKKSKSELLKEFAELPNDKKLSKVTCLYMRKCFAGGAVKDGKFNFRGYNYVSGIILDNMAKHDLVFIYQYLLDYERKDYPSIFRVLTEAKAWNEKQKALTEKERTKGLKAKKYEDFSVEELLR